MLHLFDQYSTIINIWSFTQIIVICPFTSLPRIYGSVHVNINTNSHKIMLNTHNPLCFLIKQTFGHFFISSSQRPHRKKKRGLKLLEFFVHVNKLGGWVLNGNWLCGFISIFHLQSYNNATGCNGSRSLLTVEYVNPGTRGNHQSSILSGNAGMQLNVSLIAMYFNLHNPEVWGIL